ncbi:hypothetical protein Tco_0404744 [Tanacetum coccineum]
MVATSEEHEHQGNQDNLNEISKEKDDAKPLISADTFGRNGVNDSETLGSETPAKVVVENSNGFALTFLVGYGSPKVVASLPKEFQEGDMVDALSRVMEQKS